MILIEENFDNVSVLNEEVEGGSKRLFLYGTFMQSGKKNRNGRVYESSDMKLATNQINEAAEKNRHVMGELDHPASLEVKLENVALRLMEAKLEGDDVKCKAEILPTPKGKILSSLMEARVQVGVSSRGSGSVNESSGKVSNYRFVTVDAVATPSCQSAYPETLKEQLEMSKQGQIVTDLAEAAQHDPIAQEYFRIQMRKFIEQLYN